MLTKELIDPKSIVVIGASNALNKPGGKVLFNLKDGNYKGDLFVVNPKEKEIQGIPSFNSVKDLPSTDLAIIAIAAKFCLESMEILASENGFVNCSIYEKLVDASNCTLDDYIADECHLSQRALKLMVKEFCKKNVLSVGGNRVVIEYGKQGCGV